MPTYDYQCRSCGTVTEVIHSMLEDGPTVCERCGGELRRVMHATGIIFRGSGFYKTDSRSGTGDGDKAAAAPSASKASGDGTGTSSSGPGAKSDGGGSSSGSSDASAGSSTGKAD